jgi:hypothetical protein
LRYLSSALLVIFVVALAGCNSVGKTTITTRSSLDIPSQSTAALNIGFDTDSRNKYQTEIDRLLRKELSENLINVGIFSLVERNTGDVDYLINIRVRKISVLSPAARLLFGLLAPRSQIHAQVEVLDTTTNERVTSFKVSGYGGKTALGAKSYGYDDPVREIVSHVTTTLRPYVSATVSSKQNKTKEPGNRDGANIKPAAGTSDTTHSLEVRLKNIQNFLQKGLITEEEAALKRAGLLEDF